MKLALRQINSAFSPANSQQELYRNLARSQLGENADRHGNAGCCNRFPLWFWPAFAFLRRFQQALSHQPKSFPAAHHSIAWIMWPIPAKTRAETVIGACVIVIVRIADEYLGIGFGRGCRWQGGANGLPVLYELGSAAATCKIIGDEFPQANTALGRLPRVCCVPIVPICPGS